MKKKYSIRSFLLGAAAALLAVGLATPVLAAAGRTIEVFTGVKIYVDDVQLNPTDGAGNPVEAFIYNGTTYLPVRAVSEAVGKAVQWDGRTQSVYLGKHSSDTPAAYLSKMDYYNQVGGWNFDKVIKDNLGVDHLHSIKVKDNLEHFVTYKLNGQFSRLTGTYFQIYDKRDSAQDKTSMLVISGDGRQLWQGSVGAGMDPIKFDIDISGVLELTLEYPESLGNKHCTAIGDVALWS